MNKFPAKAYREADKGEVVTINHDRYPDKVFELTARDRRPLIDPELLRMRLNNDFIGITERSAQEIMNTPFERVPAKEDK